MPSEPSGTRESGIGLARNLLFPIYSVVRYRSLTFFENSSSQLSAFSSQLFGAEVENLGGLKFAVHQPSKSQPAQVAES